MYNMRKIHFEHRYRYELEARLQTALERLQINRSAFSAMAILTAVKLWRKGKWHPTRKTPFKVRGDKSNKKTVFVQLAEPVHLHLKKMAQAMDVSMAEVLRLALDVQLTYILRDGPGILRETVSQKPQPVIRIRGVNILDHDDHVVGCIGGVLSFSICNVKDRTKGGAAPNRVFKL